MTTAASQRRESVTTRLPADAMQEVEALAAAERRPVSAVVRIAVEDWLARRRSPRRRGRTVPAVPSADTAA